MQLQAVQHIPLSNYAFAIDEHTLIIRLRTAKADVTACTLYYGDRVCVHDPIEVTETPMQKISADDLFDYFEAEVSTEFTRICYYFALSDGTEQVFYSGYGFSPRMECSRTRYFQFPYIRREDIPSIPGWAKEMVMYHIFPDSFANGKEQLAEKKSVVEENGIQYTNERGGTLKGILESVDYIRNLGINCVYLNPIFAAESYHKYDTVDYFRIDPCFGTMEDFRELVQTFHQAGIRVILDGVFNHCGSGFFAFQDVLKHGEASRYKDWFYKLKFPIAYTTPPNYEAFAYVREMPKLNTGNPEVMEYFARVGAYWIREADIDGWRLDVANEVNHEFWRNYRKAVRAEKKDALLIGEIWEDSEIWLMGDQFDSTMNYTFSDICREFFAEHRISMKEFDGKIHRMLMRYPWNVTLAQMNFLDTHDIPRFLSYCKNGAADFKLAVSFLMTCAGAPSVFYGDEQLLTGVTEPEYRRAMNWDSSQEEIVKYFTKWIGIRRKYPALQEGGYETAIVDETAGIYGFYRYTAQQRLLVLLNTSGRVQQITLPKEQGSFVDVETGITYGNEVFLPEAAGKVLQIL